MSYFAIVFDYQKRYFEMWILLEIAQFSLIYKIRET